MSQDPADQSQKTTDNNSVADVSSAGTRPPPKTDKAATRPGVESGDQNTKPHYGTDD